MRKIKVAQIGVSRNSHGEAVFESMKRQSDIFDIVGYALPENEREKFPERMKSFEGYREMTVEEILSNPEIEAVTVETEEIYITKYALMAARHGKHMHMEKPGGCTLSDFEEMIKAVKANKTVFHTGYMYRYNPAVKRALELVRSGALGEIYSVEAHMNCLHPQETRQWLESFPGGMLFFLGCHLIDLILQIQGEPLEVIPMSCSTGMGVENADDYGMVVFKYSNGISFAKTCAAEPCGFTRRQLVVCGSEGTVEIKPLEIGPDTAHFTEIREITKETADLNNWHDFGKTAKLGPYNRYDEMLATFAAMVRGEKQNPYTYDYELMLYKYVLKSCGCDIEI